MFEATVTIWTLIAVLICMLVTHVISHSTEVVRLKVAPGFDALEQVTCMRLHMDVIGTFTLETSTATSTGTHVWSVITVTVHVNFQITGVQELSTTNGTIVSEVWFCDSFS